MPLHEWCTPHTYFWYLALSALDYTHNYVSLSVNYVTLSVNISLGLSNPGLVLNSENEMPLHSMHTHRVSFGGAFPPLKILAPLGLCGLCRFACIPILSLPPSPYFLFSQFCPPSPLDHIPKRKTELYV